MQATNLRSINTLMQRPTCREDLLLPMASLMRREECSHFTSSATTTFTKRSIALGIPLKPKARLLELGGGPVIYPLISAAPYFADITFADFSKPNLEQVELWVNKDAEAHDWTPYFNHIVGSLEGKVGESQSRVTSLRSKIKTIVTCDILKEDPNGILDIGDRSEWFDVISFNFCCEVVCKTIESYQETLL